MLNKSDVPVLGAQIIIEPGQKQNEIETWFSLLSESNMGICRIRMFESYMHKEDTWNFSLFDMAFQAAEKYNIKILGTLFPETSFEDIGGFKFPDSDTHFSEICTYIEKTVIHFKQFSSLLGWVLLNEPESISMPDGEYTEKKFRQWKHQQQPSQYNSGGYSILDFSEDRFIKDYTSDYLNSLADEVHKHDRGRHVHVNPAGLFYSNLAGYDFPNWRGFLSSFGASAHGSWHFKHFNRNQYTLAMSATCELIRSGAEDVPWLMTEMQGGNNTFSGNIPMCPTKEEITQWLWTVIASEGKGGIFWCFNPRSSGFEAGEWAMINFQNKASDRLTSASSVAAVINKNKDLFARIRIIESGISLIYTRESIWIEKKLANDSKAAHDGCREGGVMKSLLGYYDVLSEMGLQCNIKEIGEFDFSEKNYKRKTIILAHQISIPSRNWENLKDFVQKGGKLIVDGLTAYYDENANCLMNNGFPLEELFGSSLTEYKLGDNLFNLNICGSDLKVQAHLWKGLLITNTSKAAASIDNDTVASRNSYGEGEVLWIPSLVGLASRLTRDKSIGVFLKSELRDHFKVSPLSLSAPADGILVKTVESGESVISFFINKSTEIIKMDLIINQLSNPRILFNDKSGYMAKEDSITIYPEETLIMKWESQ